MQKTVNLEYTISILFFITVLCLVTCTTLLGAKAEPFVWVSIFQGIMVPLTFFLSNALSINGYLYPCIMIMVMSIIASRIISQSF